MPGKSHEPAHELWIDLPALVQLLKVGFADLSEVRSRPPIIEDAVGEDLGRAMGEDLVLVPELARIRGPPSRSVELDIGMLESDVGEDGGLSGWFPHEDGEVLTVGVDPHLPDGDLSDPLGQDELAEQGLAESFVGEGDALRDDGVAEHAGLPVGDLILGEPSRRVGSADDTRDRLVCPVPAHAPLAGDGGHPAIPYGHEVEAAAEVWCPDVGGGEDAPADGESAAEELLQDGALGVRGGRVTHLDLSQTSRTESVAVLEDNALDGRALVGEAKDPMHEGGPATLDALTLREARADVQTVGAGSDYDGLLGQHGGLEGGDVTENGSGVETPRGHVVYENPLAERIDDAVGYGAGDLSEGEGEAADAAEKVEQGDAVGHGCIVWTNLSCRPAMVECGMLLQDSDREGNRGVNSAQTERAANATKEVAHRSASEEALLDEDCSNRHEDEVTMLTQGVFGIF